MIDFSTLRGLTIPEGVVVQVNNGDVIYWRASDSGSIILEVAKITSNTYAGETSYKNEAFILLDIYPNSGGTVNITYGELTKTITDDGTSENPNAQQVFFGTFNGVSDSVETPTSGTLTINGDCAGFAVGTYNKASKSSAYCSCITSVTNLGSILAIVSSSFRDCSAITNVNIPSSVVSISDNAFRSCTSLTNVNIPIGVTSIGDAAFHYCDSLTSITIPSGVTYIGGYAFANCDLTNVDVPVGVTDIGCCAFANNESLTNITIPSSVVSLINEELVDAVFGGTVLFDGCNELETLCWYSDIVLNGCIIGSAPKLVNFVFNDNDTYYTLENGCLYGKNKSIIHTHPTASGNYTILNGVIHIDKGAFFSNKNITNITIPSSVTSIGDHAFLSCQNLISVNIPSSVTSIGNYAFTSCISLTNVDIPSSVTFIGDDAFAGCESLTNVDIPSSITSINEGVFYGCSNLKSVTIPFGVESIGERAFANNESLTNITIPSSVVSIDEEAFYNCTSLTSATILATIPPTLTTTPGDIFEKTAISTITVPAGCGEAYKTAEGWNTYADYIVEAS